MSDIYYIDEPATLQDRIRSFMAGLSITLMSKLDFLARWDACDELRWWIEGQLGELFSIWHSDTADSLHAFLVGDMALTHISEWEREQIVDFYTVECSCIGCGGLFEVWETTDDFLCPDCGEDVFLGDYWSGWKDKRPAAVEFQGPAPLLYLTERRAA